MKVYEASSTIEADADTIWSILTDASHYPDWDSGVVRVEGRIAHGDRVKVVSLANPGRAFPVKGDRVLARPDDDMDGRDADGPIQGSSHVHADTSGRRRD
jgi:hypothetical protein